MSMMRPIPALVNLDAIKPKPASARATRYMQVAGPDPSILRGLREFSDRRFKSKNTHPGKRNKSLKSPHARQRGTAGSLALRKGKAYFK